MKDKNTEIDYGIIGLILTLQLLIVIGVLSFNLGQAKKELKETTKVVYHVSDKLDLAREMIKSLNDEQKIMQQEIDEMKKMQRIVKELR